MIISKPHTYPPTPQNNTKPNQNRLYELALQLIREGKAYVCHQTGEEISKSREIAKVRPSAGGAVAVHIF